MAESSGSGPPPVGAPAGACAVPQDESVAKVTPSIARFVSRMAYNRTLDLIEDDALMKNVAPDQAQALEVIETREWIDSLDYVLHQGDHSRTVRLLQAL